MRIKILPLWVILFGLFSLLPGSVFLWAASTPSPSNCPSCPAFGVQQPPEKKVAPAFTLKGLDGSQTTLNQFKGKPVFLFFWGTWCDACKEDIVLLEKFAEEKKDQLTFLTIVVDGEREKRARQIVQKLKITLPVLLVLKEKIIDDYEIRMIPQAVLIDQDGMLAGKVIGQRDWRGPLAWCTTKELFSLH